MPLVFATFNLYNLAEPGRSMRPKDGGGYSAWTESEYAKKADWTAAMLKRIDADVIGFQECWSLQALSDVFKRAGLEGAYHLIARDAAPGKPEVALAARRTLFDVREPKWTEMVPKTFRLRRGNPDDAKQPDAIEVRMSALSRPPLRVDLILRTGRPPRRRISVWVVHLKSKRPTPLDRVHYPATARHDPWKPYVAAIGSALSTVRRAAEALALRMMLTDAMREQPDLPTVVLGDLNDGTLSVTTTLITGEPPYKLWAKSTAGTKPSVASTVGLYTAETLQQYRSQRDVYYTYIHNNRLESLDHVLVSRHFYDHSPDRLWSFRELKVWNDHLRQPNRTGKTAVEWPSDHGIVTVVFDDNPAPAVDGMAVAAANEPN